MTPGWFVRACDAFDALPADAVNVTCAGILVAMLILAHARTREPAR